MADERELFNTLEESNGAGAAHAKKQEGDSPASANGSIGFAFKDSSGNVILPQLDINGKLPFSSDAPGTCKSAVGSVTVAALATEEAVATITLTASAVHTNMKANVSSTQPCKWRMEHNDSGTPTVIDHGISGSGQYTIKMEPGCDFTAGGIGTQELKIFVEQLRGKLSDAHASVSVLEKA